MRSVFLFLFYFLINTKWDTIHFLIKTHRDTSIPSSPSTHLPRLREIIHCKPAPINFKWFQWITVVPNTKLKRNNPSSLIIKTFPCKIRGIFETDLNVSKKRPKCKFVVSDWIPWLQIAYYFELYISILGFSSRFCLV